MQLASLNTSHVSSFNRAPTQRPINSEPAPDRRPPDPRISTSVRANISLLAASPADTRPMNTRANVRAYLLHRAQTAFVPCASSPSSSSAPAASPSWKHRGSSLRIQASERNGGCTSRDLCGAETSDPMDLQKNRLGSAPSFCSPFKRNHNICV